MVPFVRAPAEFETEELESPVSKTVTVVCA
jgi:hypothetical protein